MGDDMPKTAITFGTSTPNTVKKEPIVFGFGNTVSNKKYPKCKFKKGPNSKSFTQTKSVQDQACSLDANQKFLMSLTTQQLGLAKKISENYVPEIFKGPVKKDQLKCRMCHNQAIGRIDCEKWFSKNQRNKARKDNGCIATCINCTNGGNQGQSGGD